MPKMTQLEAKAIVSEMVTVHLAHVGLSKQRQVMKYELADMLKANEIVKAINRKTCQSNKSGQKTIHMTLDERAIAAMYVLMNYQASDTAIAVVNGKAMFIDSVTNCTPEELS